MQTKPLRFDQFNCTGTVLEDWFAPMASCISKQRFSDASYSALPIASFILSGCLRQLLTTGSLREYVQTLFHHDASQHRGPIARSTWADALASKVRSTLLLGAMHQLVDYARPILSDRLAHLPELAGREVIATDATYQTESAHFRPCYAPDGGCDNNKGHMLISHYDIRRGIALGVNVETESFGEMRALKQFDKPGAKGNGTGNSNGNGLSWLCVPHAIHIVDRAFIDGTFWDQRLTRYGCTVITRMKSSLSYKDVAETPITAQQRKDGILHDKIITLRSAKAQWRLIGFKNHKGELYEYLTNDLKLSATMIVFLYQRRWDKEKYYDCFKNDLAGSKAWAKSQNAIEQQALLGIVTTILTRLFLQRRQADLGLAQTDATQNRKHEKKAKDYNEQGIGTQLQSQWKELSKIPRQVWRFLKHCFDQKHELALYERQLKPLLVHYL
jgi:hypothetical protein